MRKNKKSVTKAKAVSQYPEGFPPPFRLNKRMIMQLEIFFDLVPARRLKNDLLEIFILFLSHECETLSDDFKNVAAHYYLLFQLLDVITEETHPGCAGFSSEVNDAQIVGV